MKTHVKKALQLFDDRGWLTFLVIAAVSVGIIGLVRAQTALAAQSASDYCGQYTSNSQKNACRDGLNGSDCQSYVDAGFGQAAADICTKAASDLASGNVTLDSPSPSPSPSASPSPSPSTDAQSGAEQAQIQNLLDQANSLSDYIDILHGAGPDSDVDTSEEPDDQYGSYVNGAGKQQEIEVINPGSGNSPAILFFNGGGWHSNDKVGQCVALQPSAIGYDCSGAESPNDRGYAMFDVTYRLGSSGVYYMFEDVMRGVQHMRNNAAMYGIDPNKIAVWGDSAGGSLSMRVAASGRSGAKAAVGWSAPTNGYTALFKSFQSFAVGVDHSTCIPTDLAGFTNFADLVNGGSGDVAQYGQGLSSNDFSALGIDLGGGGFSGNIDAMTLLTQGLIAGQNLLSAAQDVEAISSQISDGGVTSLTGSTFNLASKKFAECIDNFNALSPALFASPDSSPSFIAGFEDDGLIDPSQAYGMRDKLRQLGIQSDALILPGSDDCMQKTAAPAGAGGCHLGYYKDFVCKSLNFLDSLIQPERGQTDCATGVAENQGSASTGGGGAGGGAETGGGSSSGSSSGGGNSSGGSGSSSGGGQSGGNNAGGNSGGGAGQSAGTGIGGGAGQSAGGGIGGQVCDTWDSSCNGGTSASGSSAPKVTSCPVGLKPDLSGTQCIRTVNSR